jgi:glycolate oxidase FAD binding subunit
MAAAMGSSCDVSGAAHLPDHVASWFDGLPRPEASTVLRLEGFAPSVVHRKGALAALMKSYGPVAVLDEKNSHALWQSIRHVKPFAGEATRARPLWRISVPPSRGHEIAAAITPAAQMFYDWGGGLIWVAMPFADEPDATAIRGAVAAVGGHATLIRAPAAVRAAVGVFASEDPASSALAKRVKESFDPKGVLNPGRMWAGV